MRTKKNIRKMNGGSYNDHKRVTRSCTKYSSRPLRGNISKCKCENTGDEFRYDNRFFECNETGFSIQDVSQVNDRFTDLINKITEFEETYQQFETREEYIKAVNDYINKQYRVLNLDIETKNFLREYILDDFKYRRRFKGEVGARNTEILLRNLDKIKNKILKRKQTKSTFTLTNLKEELKEIIKVLENHISQVNRLMKDDELAKQIKGDPFEYSGTRTDLKTILTKVKSGEITLSKNDLSEKINDAFKGVIKEVLAIVEKFTEYEPLKNNVKIRLNRDFGQGDERKKEFYFKYNKSADLLKKFTVKFLRAVVDSQGANNYKYFIDRSSLIDFIKLLVKYDSRFKDGAEKGVDKYFESNSLTDIVNKIKSDTTLDNFITRQKSVIEGSAGLRFSDDSFNSSKSPSSPSKNMSADKIVSKLLEMCKQVNRDDAKKLNDLIKMEGKQKFVNNNRLTGETDNLKSYLGNFFSKIHSDVNRVKRRTSQLKELKVN